MSGSAKHFAPSRALLGLLLAGAGLAIGYLAGRFSPPTQIPEQDRHEESPAPASADAEQREQLAALGYSAGSVKATARSGVTVYNAAAAYNAYNLYTSGHFPGAVLMTMDGKEVHRWERSFEDLWPKKDPEKNDVSYWRRVHLFDNGDIIATIEPFGIFRLDRDSNVIWKNDCGAHHDFYVAENGHIFTLARKPRTMVPVVGLERPILEDFVLELDETGKELRRVSIFEALNASDYRPLLYNAPSDWDITHTNSLKFLGPETTSPIPAIQPGRFLLSLRSLDTIAVLNFDQARIEWSITGMWHRQHEATLLGSGNLLLFNNMARDDASRVLEVDPATHEIVWAYGAVSGQNLFSQTCGLAKRLANGNTLITESVPGRVIEVAPDHTILWEYVNPHHIKTSADTTASIFDFKRLPKDFAPSWLSPAVEANGR